MSLAWTVLILSGVLEAVWASALDASRGFRRLWPSVLFLVSLLASFLGLAYAMLEIPVGTAYAVWVGIGAVLTAAWAMATRRDRPTLLRIALLFGLVACVVGLKVVS
ncbi:DMT family transporter [Leucobacter massiliensis]|uniref:Ligand-binding protein SH3 n=1 Tax=Leucobacter massiliensis TaxID=1686285 RepID=A0A2S9QMN9_9MICO|nr:multidrug efflux SMR transporter [Leucobacter massiliensis]PRI10848.1 ligand-binding protein SH3 [Leucobacter massiliensis]